MKKFLNRLVKNIFGDVLTSIAGTVAGAEDLIMGIAEKDASKIIKGTGIIFLGLISNTNTKK